MRKGHEQGGVQDSTFDLKAAGYMSTSRLSAKVGLPIGLPVSFIVNELAVKPELKGPTGSGYYWSPESVRRVRAALISHLALMEFEE